MNAYYKDLYDLQDKILSIVFNEKTSFYLSGGTALSRFYLLHRYSDDLDFFTHDTVIFSELFRIVYNKIKSHCKMVSIDVDSRDFKRILITEDTVKLKVDFISDKIQRIGLPVLIHNNYIDSIRNILSNKICAILDRDAERDIVDLIYISKSYFYNWQNIGEDCQLKEIFTIEDLVFRLKSFPLALLTNVPFINTVDVKSLGNDLEIIVNDCMLGSDNSLGIGKEYLGY
jgi:predicted nucleotidyltransferase component of viral defense system